MTARRLGNLLKLMDTLLLPVSLLMHIPIWFVYGGIAAVIDCLTRGDD